MGLTAPSGPFQVASLTLEIPVKTPRCFSEDKFKLNGKPALDLQTVLFNIYYPSQPLDAASKVGKKEGALWLNSPRFKSVEGLLKYAGISKYWAPVAILPAAGLLFARLPFPQAQPLASNASKFPVAVFSHGLGGTRTFYSQYCASLASNGVVCFAIEHRDASGPHSSIYKPKAGSNSSSDPTHDSLTYFKFSELDNHSSKEGLSSDDRPEAGSSTSTPPDEWEFRRAQIKFRCAEIMEVVDVLRDLGDGKGEEIMNKSTRTLDGKPKSKNWSNEEESKILRDFENKLDLGHLWSLGHSFGSATMISLLRSFSNVPSAGETSSSSSSSSSPSSTVNPFQKSVLLDPWLEPLYRSNSDPDYASHTQPTLKTPIFVIDSQGFTVWRAHFPYLKSYVAESKANSGRAWLTTLSGSGHTDFSDFPYTLPRFFKSKVPVEEALKIFSKMTLLEIKGANGDLKEVEKCTPTDGSVTADHDLDLLKASLKEINVTVREELDGEVKRKDLGEPGVIILHPIESKL